MITEERLEELIKFQEQNISQMDTTAKMFGGPGNAIIEMIKGAAAELTNDTIAALKEYRDMRSIRKYIDGGKDNG